MEDIKPLDLPLPDFDPSKFDQAGFLRDVSALEKQGLFETIETDNQLRDILAGLFAKNYGNGEHLFVLSAIRENRDHLQKLAHELDRAIARKEGEDEGRRQGVESAANLQGVLAEIADIKAQGEEVKKNVGDIVGKVNESQGAAYSTLKIAKAIPEKMTRAIAGASVRIKHLKEAVEKTDGNLGDLRRTQLATLAAVGEIRDGKTADGKSTVPDPRDYQMTTTALSQLLEEKNCKRSMRQIELWEKYLKTNGREGTRPPMGYSLSTRLTPETAAAWVKTYAADEATKNAVRVHFDDRRHQRPK